MADYIPPLGVVMRMLSGSRVFGEWFDENRALYVLDYLKRSNPKTRCETLLSVVEVGECLLS